MVSSQNNVGTLQENISSSVPLFLFLAGFYIVWSLRATILFFDDGIQSEVLRNIYSSAIKFILWVLPVFAYLKYVDGRNPFSYLKISTVPQQSEMIFSVIAIILYFAGLIIIAKIFNGKSLRSLFNSPLSEIAITFLLVFFSPIWEEIMYRGFILQKLKELIGFWKGNLLTSLLFVLVHWPYWIWTKGFHLDMLNVSARIFILSCFLGFLVKKSNSLWPSVSAHIINNFLAKYLGG